MLPVAANDLNLPARTSPIPATTSGVPHIQLNAKKNAKLYDSLLERVADIPGVNIRKTVISLPGAMGFWLDKDVAVKKPEAIVGGREFAHIHTDGSLHASLAPPLASEAVKKGWATYHPWSQKRAGWEGFVMIYTPQTQDELELVFQLVMGSYQYITGQDNF